MAYGETAEEVLLLILEHIKTSHGLYEIPHTITDGFRKFIHVEAPVSGQAFASPSRPSRQRRKDTTSMQ